MASTSNPGALRDGRRALRQARQALRRACWERPAAWDVLPAPPPRIAPQPPSLPIWHESDRAGPAPPWGWA